MIQPGQTYRSLSNRHHPADGPTRIRIANAPIGATDIDGMRKVYVVTLTPDGREIRPRWMRADRLHTTATTRDGAPRRTGYVQEGT
ncbi:hypothetical protein J7F02_34515 [Streptomyces sp. ISL-112]|uniref:hypothetical protein n=1 Tax=unclassified Streptomyces TaxID=2593676 RepID=UPI001BEB40B1|nr:MULTISPECIES: hypothetical protein [unclassified Streptomyces]MBT2430551.1 hypothetical protein [Streptomyces sp. ISL-112]MBT2465861.1 hypothetical protein [Streptomyces sp. ISL-63]